MAIRNLQQKTIRDFSAGHATAHNLTAMPSNHALVAENVVLVGGDVHRRSGYTLQNVGLPVSRLFGFKRQSDQQHRSSIRLFQHRREALEWQKVPHQFGHPCWMRSD
jgi:hypothetical protein